MSGLLLETLERLTVNEIVELCHEVNEYKKEEKNRIKNAQNTG